MTKEEAYDEFVSPLMQQVITLCKEHKINAFMTFALDVNDEGNVLWCTSSLPVDPDDVEGNQKIDEFLHVARPTSLFAAFTITSKPKP